MNETIHLCTLFDSNYLDKGLAMYYSLKRVCDNFKLYIFPFDQIAKGILIDLNLENVEIIDLEQFETEELLKVKEKRSKGEYCWTCTPVIIKYVLEHFPVDCCTYIDSDLFFYQSPQILLREFYRSRKSVGLVEHRFPDTYYGKINEKRSGRYCVQFNTFKDDEKAKMLLEQWRLQCLRECSLEGIGDQLYLTNWGEEYEEVYEYQNFGGGVAPWNLPKYRIKERNNCLYVLFKGEKRKLIFYHFHGIRYSRKNWVKVSVISAPDGGLVRKKTIKMIYYPYLSCIESIRKELRVKYALNYYKDGCGREFTWIKFDLKKFCTSFFHKLTKESVWSAIDLAIRVFRKKSDMIDLRTLGNGTNTHYL